MIWLIISYLLYAINNVVWKWLAVNGEPVYLINRRSMFTSMLAFAALLYTVPQPFDFLALDEFRLLLLSCSLGVIGLLTMVTALQQVSLRMLGYYSILGIVVNGYYSYILQNQKLNTGLILASLLILGGFILFQWDETRKSTNKQQTLKQHLMMLLMTLCFSLSGIIAWNIIDTLRPIEMMATQEIFVLLVSSSILLLKKSKKKDAVKPALYLFPIFALIIGGAVFSGLMGLKINNPYIAAIGGLAVPLLTVAFGAIFFREKMNVRQVIAFVLVISGEILMI